MRWLAGHPEVELACLMARVEKEEAVERYFPGLRSVIETPIRPVDMNAMTSECDAVFLCLPHTAAQEFAAPLVKAGVKVFDLSADFRFDSIETYEKTYGVRHLAPELNSRFPYALPELFGADISGAPGVACPGCYPTATLLGLAPLMTRPESFDLDHIVVNALSGVSGAGRKLEENYLFVECNESVSAYSVGKHRHRPEIEEKLTRLAGRDVRLTFTTHLIPMNRGILATTAVPLRGAATSSTVHDLYAEFYEGKPFIRLLPAGSAAATGPVAMTNFCDIGVTVDSHAGTLIVVSAIDNLAKGAASQGVQAMNLLFGLPETLGLLPRSMRRSHV